MAFGTGNPVSSSGQTGRKVARYKKNRRAVYNSTPNTPYYTMPTIAGVGSGEGSGTLPGPVLTINFDVAVSLQSLANKPLPAWTDATQGLVVTAAVQTSPTQIVLTFSGTVQPGDTIHVPDLDPPIRTAQGGFVNPGNYTVP